MMELMATVMEQMEVYDADVDQKMKDELDAEVDKKLNDQIIDEDEDRKGKDLDDGAVDLL